MRTLFPALLTVFTAAAVGQQTNPAGETHETVAIPRCAKIAGLGPKFEPLVNACQFALSPTNLPDFSCDQTVQQFRSYSGPNNWSQRHVITDVSTFEHAKGDKYSSFFVDGHRVRTLSKPYTASEVIRYFVNNIGSRPPPLTEFGTDLLWVFDPRDEAEFEYKGQMRAGKKALSVFGFHVTKSAKHLPVIGWYSPGEVGSYVGLNGLIWINEQNLGLTRIVMNFEKADPVVNLGGYSAAIDYDWTQISDLGKFLLPTSAEDIECSRQGSCWRNTVKFSNCHKFASTARIVQVQPQ